MINKSLFGGFVFFFLVLTAQGSSLRKAMAEISSTTSSQASDLQAADLHTCAGMKRPSDTDLTKEGPFQSYSPKKSLNDAILQQQFIEAVDLQDMESLRRIVRLTKETDFKIQSPDDQNHWTYPLHYILYRRDGICFAEVFPLLSNQIDLIDSSGHSALSLAIATDARQAFKVMLPKSTDLDLIVLGGLKLMHLAAMIPKRKYYLDKLIDLAPEQLTEPCLRNGWTPFIYAALQDINENFEFLSESAAIGLIEHANNGPLLHVIYNAGQFSKIATLLKHEPTYDYQDGNGDNILHLAARDGRADVIEAVQEGILPEQFDLLLEARNEADQVPIYDAIKRRHLGAVKLMAKQSIPYLAMVPVAIEYGALDVLKYLVESKIYMMEEWPYSDVSELLFAYTCNQRHITDYLLEMVESDMLYEVDSETRYNILQLAVDRGDSVMAARLINKGFDVNRFEEGTNSPLAIAVAKKNAEIVQMLVRAGAKLDVVYEFEDGERIPIADMATPSIQTHLNAAERSKESK